MEKILQHQFGQDMTLEQQKELFKAVLQLKQKPGLKVDPMELVKILMDQKNAKYAKPQHLIEDDSDEEENSESEEFEQDELQYEKIPKKKPQTKKKPTSDGLSDSDEVDLEDDQDSDSDDDSDAQVYLDEDESDIIDPSLIKKEAKVQSSKEAPVSEQLD